MTISVEEFEQLRREVQVLKDIEAIKRVKHAYLRCLDTGNLEEMAGLFHEDVLVHFIGGNYVWKLNGRQAYIDSIAKSLNSKVVAQHNAHHPEIDVLSETEATGIWYLNDNFWNLATRRFVTGTLLYRDRYLKTDGRWQIKETRYERIYEMQQVLTQDLPLTAHLLGRMQ